MRFYAFSMAVEIVHSTEKQHRIKFLEYHADGRKPGTTIKVSKTSVKGHVDRVNATAPVRLPYKDND